MAANSTIDALKQFELHPLMESLGSRLGFSESPLFMLITVVVLLVFLYTGTLRPRIIPPRMQAAVELCYEFVFDMVLNAIGPKGKPYFPFIFTLLFFILIGNYVGLVPFSFAFTSHIAVTATLALIVFGLAIIVSIRSQGIRFFAHFLPDGAPLALAPLLVPIEIISYLSRPVSLAIRLFANMVAGHVMFEMFAAFTIILGGLGYFGTVLSVGPLALNVALIALELLVGALQAYVFAILACIYLRESLGH